MNTIKKTQTIAAVMFAAVALSSCGDKKEAPMPDQPEPTKAEMIIGKWEATLVKYTPKPSGAPTSYVPTKEHPMFWTFGTDGILLSDLWHEAAGIDGVEEWKHEVEEMGYTLSPDGGHISRKMGEATDVVVIKDLKAGSLTVVIDNPDSDQIAEVQFKKVR